MAGTPCVFLRLSLCNRWDGRPETRAASQCPFCDTDFHAREYLEAREIVRRIRDLSADVQWVWISGGEPAIQVDPRLLTALHREGLRVGMETNGSIGFEGRAMIDHMTVSPKQPWEQTVVQFSDDLKLLYPHPDPRIRPEAFTAFSSRRRYLQPIWDDDPEVREQNMRTTIHRLTTDLTGWRLSVQTHKYIGVE